MKRLVVLWAGVMLLLFQGYGLAEENKTTMEEVVVTATKTEEARKNIPNAVILMDEIDIEESPAGCLGELLGNELGIDWRTYGDYGGAAQTVHIRGMRDADTQVLVNGISMNSPSLGSADVGRIQLNNIDKIEVVKGSGSLLYGSGAMAGTVNILTKRPEHDEIAIKASAGYGSNNTYRLSAEQGMFVSKDLGYYLSANRKETDGTRANSDQEYTDASLRIVLDKGEFFDASLYTNFVNEEHGTPGVTPPDGTRAFYINGVQFYNSECGSLLNNGSNEDTHSVLEIKSTPVKWLSFDIKGTLSNMKNYLYQRYNGPAWPSLAGEGLKTWVNNKVLGTEGSIELKPFKGMKVLAGADYKDHAWKTKNIAMDTFGAEKTASETLEHKKLHSSGIFTEAQYRPNKYIKGLMGIRQEKHSTFGVRDLPLYGLVMNPLEKTAIKVTHGKHFKAPTPNDLFWPEDAWTRGNPALKPQTGWHTDYTAEQSLVHDKIFLSLSYFEWDIQNKITWAPNPSFGGKWTPTNKDSSYGKGYEFGSSYKPIDNIILSVSYTELDAYDEADGLTRRSQNTPRQTFKGKISWWSDFGLSASTAFSYVGSRDYYRAAANMHPTDSMDAYWKTDINIEQTIRENWSVSLQCNNIFDKGYDTYVAQFTDSTGARPYGRFPGEGRNLFLNITFRY